MLGWRAARLSAIRPMRDGEDDAEPPCTGAFVVLEPIATGYLVRLEAPPGSDLSRSCPTKDEAWNVAASLWSALRLPLRDLKDHNVRLKSHAASNFRDDSV